MLIAAVVSYEELGCQMGLWLFSRPTAESMAAFYLFLHVSHNALEDSDGTAPWCTL